MEIEEVERIITGEKLPGLRNVRNRGIQEQPDFYEVNRARLQAADIAYFSHNASLDDGPIGDDEFHPDFLYLSRSRSNSSSRSILQLALRRAVLDHAAKLDQITGGTTLVVHMPSALEPMTPARSEYLKAYVYAPGTVIREFQRENRENPIPSIVHKIIEELGVASVERFERARSRKWPYPRNVNATKPQPLPNVVGMPQPIPDGSSRYLVYGRQVPSGQTPRRALPPVGLWDIARNASDGGRHGGGGIAGYPATESTTLSTVDY
ncbi:hypothetical protein FA13DRAFT_1711523 [Coprinellus micaceus]|uniref:Uncharacterized protein n=1 Tax=Coprinellus micaceus TaxID=71717 RepID=A0A4Y7T5I1_COPMI|nr:hypothetical protein FA13DRAFT_1711523 [Coprinellus micaceus]